MLTLAFRITDLKSNGARFVHLTHDLGVCRQAQCGGPFSFPISVGKRHSYRLPFGVDGYEIPKCEVAAVEQVTVQAGTFEAFRVECSGNWLTQGTEGLDKVWQGRTNSTYWYAPAVNAPVRWLVQVYDPKGKPTDRVLRELVSFVPGHVGSDPMHARDAPAVAAALPAEFVIGGTKFAGQFTAVPGGKYSGTGRVTWANGDDYDGPLVNGLREGVGRFTWANGQRYEGLWRGDRPEGHGKLMFANGNVYEGDVVDGVPEGRGTLTYASGDVYVGGLRAGLPHGEGTLNSKSGDRYIGAWKAGLKDGRGVLVWASGDRWEGAFVKDERTEGMLVRKAP